MMGQFRRGLSGPLVGLLPADVNTAGVRDVVLLDESGQFSDEARELCTDDELTPTRGCSAPTFHGSAQDMAAIAGTLLSVAGLSMQAGRSGAHPVAVPRSGVTPSDHYIPSTLCPMLQ
jgi:hypothetical protein